jgi:L-asparaginase II
MELTMSTVVVRRGGIVESVHRVHAVVVDGDGRRIASVGNPEYPVFHRSAAKPFQAVPLVEDGVVERFGLTPPELALCCASHSSEPMHIETAWSILGKASLREDDLECGPHPPFHEESASELLRSGQAPTPIHNNCSGKHAGMLALAKANDWPTRGYIGRDHPVQQRMITELVRWTGLTEGEIGLAQDGCGVVCFSTPASALALGFARLGGSDGPAHQVVRAITAHPFMVAGTGRFGTALGVAAGDRVFGKTGAEGVFAVGAVDGSFGLAVKVEDGGTRASSVAVVRILDEPGVLDGIVSEELDGFRSPPTISTRGVEVGDIRPEFDLDRPG